MAYIHNFYDTVNGNGKDTNEYAVYLIYHNFYYCTFVK